jgi:hypothetical protein
MYFQEPGHENTDKTLEIAISAARQRDISHLVVASTTGATAEKALKRISGTKLNLIVVTHNVGFAKPEEDEFDSRIREKIEKAGHVVHTGTMVTRNLNKAISEKMGGYSEAELVNATLRMFSQGIKVCVEMAAMACDSGLIPFSDVICVAGTGEGADTAVVIGANSSNRFFDIKVKEILCKPFNF